jgi:outer membrane autotransporter protein
VSGSLLLVNNLSGSGTGSGPVSVAALGTLGGTGAINGAVTNSGKIAPGASIGTLTVNNNVTMNANSHLAIELSGTSADRLVVGGNLDLSAAEFLDVTGSGSGPWVIATYGGTLLGTFDSVTSGYNVDYSTSGQIILNAMALPGDYNGDGKVDAADYVAWRMSPSTFSGSPAGYNAWRANYGNPAAGSSGADFAVQVPEPTSLAIVANLMALGFLPLFLMFRVQRRREEGKHFALVLLGRIRH